MSEPRRYRPLQSDSHYCQCGYVFEECMCFTKAIEVYQGSDGSLTKRYYAELEKRGSSGQVAINLFRAQKCSTRAKVYRGRRFKNAAYDTKSWAMANLVMILARHAAELGIRYGWKPDPATVFGDQPAWVFYVDLPERGQVSFDSPTRIKVTAREPYEEIATTSEGPDYPGDWDGQHKSAERIIAFCDQVYAQERKVLRRGENLMKVVARESTFHPIRQYLDALNWDGEGRVDSWLINYLGADPGEYVAAVGALWLIGAVARIYQPGCKNDTCLILEGKQGTLKSTAMRTMGGIWFSDCMPELGSKAAQLQMRGVWIIELSDLDSMTRGVVERVKAFMSQAVDRYRPPYGRAAIDVPRECVFVGTSNHANYLREETGARRFWPVECGAIDIELLRRDRDQLWAEAVVRYREGDPWWLDKGASPNAPLAEEQGQEVG